MIQHFSRKREQVVLEQGLCPVLMSFVLALGHLQSFLLTDNLLPQVCFQKGWLDHLLPIPSPTSLNLSSTCCLRPWILFFFLFAQSLHPSLSPPKSSNSCQRALYLWVYLYFACSPETCIILLTSVTSINLIKCGQKVTWKWAALQSPKLPSRLVVEVPRLSEHFSIWDCL